MSNLRDQFLLRPGIIYLNHGSYGACPRPVFEAYQHYQLELERHPGAFLGRCSSELLPEARRSLAAYVGADSDDVVYVTNATTGINIVARSLALEAGDEVLTSDHEYGAMDRTWQFVCAKRGARYVRQPLPLPVASAEQAVEAIWSGVTARTRVLFLSHITSPTALILPMAELIRRARAAGIITVVDGAHAPGQIPLALAELGVDYYTGNCHKWMLSPKGSGYLYARREMQHLLEPLIVSWGWDGDLAREAGSTHFVDEQQYTGTRDLAAFLAVPAAIEFMEAHDWPGVRAACHALLRETRERVAEMTGLVPITPDGPEWYGQMAGLALPAGDIDELSRRLRDDYHIEVPIVRWNGTQLARVSVQGYNTRDDLETLVCALRDWLAG